MSKKNKKRSEPAVGVPAAGSNNKREKLNSFKQKLKNKKVFIAVSVFAAAVLICVTVMFFCGSVNIPDEVRNAQFKGRLEADSVAIESVLSDSQQKKLSKAVKAKGNVGTFDFYVNEEISIDEQTDPALLEFGSVSSNDCVLLAFLIDENGEIIYRSLGVEAGKEIRSVRLFDSVAYGTRNATLVVNGYDTETYEKIGTQSVKICLKIGVDSVEE